MGLIKLGDEVIYKGLVGKVDINPNWCDSMAEYYPYIVVTYVDASGEIWTRRVNTDIRLSQYLSEYTIEVDKDQSEEIDAIRLREKLKKEASRIDYHKVVKVVRGRKVPRGTVGEVFWMGDSGYGMSVGLRLLDGSKVFTAQNNVEVVMVDQEFESIVLGTKS